MKRTLLFCGLTFLLGLFLGLFFRVWFPVSTGTADILEPAGTANALPLTTDTPTVLPSDVPTVESDSPSFPLLQASYTVLEALRDLDYEALAACVHSSGVRFTPYSTVDTTLDVVLTAAQISAAPSDTQVYTWGTVDGSGEPLEATIPDYFARYVCNTDYTSATRIGVNQVIQSGNALENIADAYPDAQFVDFNFSGLDPALDGLDWCSLKLVFQEEDGAFKLIGIVHGEWTI